MLSQNPQCTHPSPHVVRPLCEHIDSMLGRFQSYTFWMHNHMLFLLMQCYNAEVLKMPWVLGNYSLSLLNANPYVNVQRVKYNTPLLQLCATHPFREVLPVDQLCFFPKLQ
jgi:hypothetical protein